MPSRLAGATVLSDLSLLCPTVGAQQCSLPPRVFRCLHLEFEQLWAQLLVHSSLLSLVEVVTLVQAKEIRLCGVLSSFSTVLATQTASPSPTPTSTLVPTMVPLALGGIVVVVVLVLVVVFYHYCNATTHTIEKCRHRPPCCRGGSPTLATSASPQSHPEWALDLAAHGAPLASSVVSSVAARVP